ncbi:hypothetical protein [Trichormus azollae]|uniref:hypothetical protein n=1 Tax=Trichormus azollae TaxID=1164 RepID=UPI00325D6CE3
MENTLQVLPQETVLSEAEFHTLLDTYLPKLGSQQRTLIMEAVAIAFYDDASQFKLLTDNIALFWVHQGRYYKKLSPFIPCHQEV